MAYEHLRFSREAPLTERHRRRGGGVPPPPDPRGFGAGLRRTFETAKQPAADELTGYDNRVLFKVQLRDNVSLPDLEQIPGVELVSHEDKSIVLAFANATGLETFESRLTSLATNGVATRKELLYALESFDHWTAEDRKGAALRQQGFEENEPFVLDVELWPLTRQDQRQALLEAFRTFLTEQGIEKLDELNQPSLIMARVRCSKAQAEDFLLKHRDVRMVDLPPRAGVSVALLLTDINQLPQIPEPSEDAPAVAILDTGLTTGHPVLANAVGDAQGYLAPTRAANDNQPWHGTLVSGLAVYGDVQECLRQGQFIPQLRLFSGKVFEDGNNNQTTFVEKAVEEAVRALREQYGCKVFNLSYGDENKVYDGRHVRGLAYTLDRLTRELGVLFIVPTGNLKISDLPADPRASYPDYLLEDRARLLDPSPALNALTIGGLARYTATRDAQRHPDNIEDFPIALADQPFPLGRSGLSIGKAIKPDLVEHAGNLAVGRIGNRRSHGGLGIISTSGDFANGHPFVEDIGTSYAAPQVAHRAARLLSVVPNASDMPANLLRALLAAHAHWPSASVELLNSTNDAAGKERLLKLIGYGRIDDEALYRSIDQAVTLLAEDRIVNDKCHIYELPIPDDFWSSGKRQREVTVALAYSPDIRTTRLDYRMTKLWFNLVKANTLDEVETAFTRNRVEGLPELTTNRSITNDDRKAGTLQVSRWAFKLPPQQPGKLFVVVTRQDAVWGAVADGEEPYALVTTIADRENEQVNLYAQIRAQLEARAQARARARV
jgi:hypothetical protein